jgi:hypothetical protein
MVIRVTPEVTPEVMAVFSSVSERQEFTGIQTTTQPDASKEL